MNKYAAMAWCLGSIYLGVAIVTWCTDNDWGKAASIFYYQASAVGIYQFFWVNKLEKV